MATTHKTSASLHDISSITFIELLSTVVVDLGDGKGKKRRKEGEKEWEERHTEREGKGKEWKEKDHSIIF